MKKLSEKRQRFTLMVAKLILRAKALGFDPAIDMVKRCETCPVGNPKSCHKVGLAVDLLLYRDGEYLTHPDHYKLLHDYWDKLGGAKRIHNDMNHFSIEWMGIR